MKDILVKIKTGYFYLFYKLYKFYEKGSSVWWSHGKAILTLDVVLFLLVYSFIVYYAVFINRTTNIGGEIQTIWILGALILIPNYFIFEHRDQWKEIVVRFDKLPKKKNIIGGWIVLLIVLIILINLIYSFYLMSQIDWSQYK